MIKRWWLAVFALGIGMVLTAAGQAQDGGLKTIKLDELVVTATKTEAALKEVPAAVTVISREQIANQNLPNGDIGDLLRSVPGISLRRAYAPFPASANLRGAGSDSTVYLVNGIPLDWQISQTIAPEMIAKVEIIRGPASALYGANASGGVVNIILKDGAKENQLALSSGAGSFGRFRGAASAEGHVNNFGYALAGFYEDAEGTNIVENNVNPSIHMIGNCNYDKRGTGISTGYRLSEATNLKVFYNFFNDRYQRGRPNVGGDWDYSLAGLILDQKVGQRINVKASLAYREDDYLHLYDRNATNYLANQKRDMDYVETPMELQATARLAWGHTLTAGIFYNNQATAQDYRNWFTGQLTQETTSRCAPWPVMSRTCGRSPTR
jgi:iron complex outermembrane receptor protein